MQLTNKVVAAVLILLLLSCHSQEDRKENSNPQNSTEAETAKSPSQAPIMGWASWNNYRININEDIIKSQADAMVSSGLKDAGYVFINIER